MILPQPTTELSLAPEALADVMESQGYKRAREVWYQSERSRNVELDNWSDETKYEPIRCFEDLTLQERFDVMKIVSTTELLHKL